MIRFWISWHWKFWDKCRVSNFWHKVKYQDRSLAGNITHGQEKWKTHVLNYNIIRVMQKKGDFSTSGWFPYRLRFCRKLFAPSWNNWMWKGWKEKPFRLIASKRGIFEVFFKGDKCEFCYHMDLVVGGCYYVQMLKCKIAHIELCAVGLYLHTWKA